MAILSDLLSRVRLELGDNAQQFTTKLIGDGSTKDFYLKVKPVDATYLTVTITGNVSSKITNLSWAANAGPSNFWRTTLGTTVGISGTSSTAVTLSGLSNSAFNTATWGATNYAPGITSTQVTLLGYPGVDSSQSPGITSSSSASWSVTDAPLANPTDFTVEENIGMIHFTNAPPAGSTITVSGTHYRYFTTSELTTFVNTAVTQHTDNRTDSYGSQVTIASIPPVEEYPVALLATTEALWALATDAAFDINISAPDGVVIPRNQRFAQLSNIIQARREQYRELCAALNIGLWRIEMGVLRRVSRTTNKLVPVYMPQEIDDSTIPERVYIENNLKGRTPLPSNVGVYDIILTQGDVWSVPFDFPIDLTGYLVKAQARTYPGSPVVAADITCTITDVANGKVTLSLTHDQTLNLPLKCFWDLQIYKADESFNETYVRGLMFTNRQVTVE